MRRDPATPKYVAAVLKAKKVYSVDDASAYATGLVTAFDSAATGLKMSVTHQTVPGTTQCQAGTGDVSEYQLWQRRSSPAAQRSSSMLVTTATLLSWQRRFERLDTPDS